MKRSQHVLGFISCVLLSGSFLWGQDKAVLGENSAQEENENEEIVITATRTETPKKRIGSSITSIGKDEIERKGEQDVLDILRDVAGLDFAQSGGKGGSTSLFIRGANSEHTLVLIDGVEANDSISPGRSFDFGNLSVDNIERIEVLRGPQSTLYGSDAIGGVVHIITKKGSRSQRLKGVFETGSYGTFSERLSFEGAFKDLNYAFALSRYDQEGFSAASEDLGNSENDGLQRSVFSGRFGFKPSPFFSTELITRYTKSKLEIDNSGGAGGDDPNSIARHRQLFTRVQTKGSFFDRVWEPIAGFSLTKHERNDHNGKDEGHPDDLSMSSFNSKLIKFDLQNTVLSDEAYSFIFGLETEEERGDSEFFSDSAFGPFTSNFAERKQRTTGAYLQAQLEFIEEVFFLTLGARHDDHERSGPAFTYRLASTYVVEPTHSRFKASFGTGFKSPSLFQLFSSFGNPELDPEDSRAWDIGLEQPLWDERAIFSLTFFRNDFKNLIDFDAGANTYFNSKRAKSEGVELDFSFEPSERVGVSLNYTYTDTEDKRTGQALLRRPQDKFNIDLRYSFLEKQAYVSLGIRFVGRRPFNDFSTFPATRVHVDDYTLVNLSASYWFNDSLRCFCRINNLFDEEYEEILGFGRAGISAFIGVELQFQAS